MSTPYELLRDPELTEIFEADPALLSDEAFAKLISHYRAERELWVEVEAKPKKTKAEKAPPIDLKDLEL